MAGNVLVRAREVTHERNPKDRLLEEIEPYLEGLEIGGCDLLLAVYELSANDKTKGGLYLPADTRKENAYQGKVGLVVKLGPMAYSEDRGTDKWFKVAPKIGDWVAASVVHSRTLLLGSTTCRLVEDKFIDMIIPRPDMMI